MIDRILIVEDDKEILENISHVLKQRHGINSTALTTGEDALKFIKINTYDAIVIDLMLPGIDGHELCKKIRELSDVPIIMITALEDVSERLLAFELGVDDFLVKPFNVNELVARIKAIYKRINTTNPNILEHKIYHFRNWTLNTANFTLTSDNDVEVSLSSSDYKLLVVFLDNPNRILTRDHLIECTQHRSRDVNDRSIDVRVSLLRKKFEINTDLPLIKTVHNQGYIFISDVEIKSI